MEALEATLWLLPIGARTSGLAWRHGPVWPLGLAHRPLVAGEARQPVRLVVECGPLLVLVPICNLPASRHLRSALFCIRLLVLVRFLPEILS